MDEKRSKESLEARVEDVEDAQTIEHDDCKHGNAAVKKSLLDELGPWATVKRFKKAGHHLDNNRLGLD